MGTAIKIVVAVCVAGMIGVVAVVTILDTTSTSIPSSAPVADSGETASSGTSDQPSESSTPSAEEDAEPSSLPTEDAPPEPSPAPSDDEAPAPPEPADTGTESIHWIGQAAMSALVPLDAGLRQLALAVTEASDGQLVLTVETGIVPGGQEWAGVADGYLDFCAGGGSYYVDELRFGPAFTQLPAGMPPLANLEFHRAAGAEIMNAWFEDKHWQLYDIPGAGFHGTPEVWIHTNKRIRTLDDLTLMKVATGSTDTASILESMGMTPVWIPVSEIAEAMERDVIDSCECGSAATNYLMGLGEVSDYAYVSPTRGPTQAFEFLVNSRSFEALPSDLQALVVDVARDQALQFHEAQLERDEEALDQMQDEGVSVRTLPSSIDDLFVDKAREFYRDKVEEYPELEEYLEAYFEFADYWEDEYGFSYPVMTGLD